MSGAAAMDHTQDRRPPPLATVAHPPSGSDATGAGPGPSQPPHAGPGAVHGDVDVPVAMEVRGGGTPVATEVREPPKSHHGAQVPTAPTVRPGPASVPLPVPAPSHQRSGSGDAGARRMEAYRRYLAAHHDTSVAPVASGGGGHSSAAAAAAALAAGAAAASRAEADVAGHGSLHDRLEAMRSFAANGDPSDDVVTLPCPYEQERPAMHRFAASLGLGAADNGRFVRVTKPRGAYHPPGASGGAVAAAGVSGHTAGHAAGGRVPVPAHPPMPPANGHVPGGSAPPPAPPGMPSAFAEWRGAAPAFFESALQGGAGAGHVAGVGVPATSGAGGEAVPDAHQMRLMQQQQMYVQHQQQLMHQQQQQYHQQQLMYQQQQAYQYQQRQYQQQRAYQQGRARHPQHNAQPQPHYQPVHRAGYNPRRHRRASSVASGGSRDSGGKHGRGRRGGATPRASPRARHKRRTVCLEGSGVGFVAQEGAVPKKSRSTAGNVLASAALCRTLAREAPEQTGRDVRARAVVKAVVTRLISNWARSELGA